ncbi:MAG: hypothetical protein V1901_04330 [Patescibacteria group bacterium]
MKYDELKQAFATDEAVVQLLETLKPHFDTIDDYAQQMIQGILGQEELKEVKTRLTGIIATLNPVYSKGLSLKKQKEYRYYVQKKEECEKAGTKFTDGGTEKEAKAYVENYRNVRDLIAGYLKSAESIVYDCKDRILQYKYEEPIK